VISLPDANVLIALVATDHVHHDVAEGWFATAADRFATCPITQGSLVRFLVRGGHPRNTVHAVLTTLAEDGRHEFWPDDLSYRDVPLTGVIGHRQVADSYLAQLARERGGRLVTFDQGLAKQHHDVAELIPTRPPSPRSG
jgi:toxin-antitoxin system PIN domain toxin